MSERAERRDPVPQPVDAAEAERLFGPLANEKQLLIAVSGGPDSVALLGLLAGWAASAGRPALAAATVDHGLRQGSAAEAEAVAGLCAQLGVPHAVLPWLGARRAGAVQEQARAARYRLLAAEARRIGGAAVVTAHTLDDQAETVLMRLARGSGPAGLAAMRPRSRVGGMPLHRPLLAIAKERLVETARAQGWPFAADPSNADPRFERVRWRALAPVLAEAGLDARRLALLAERCARLDAAAQARVEAIASHWLVAEGDAVRLDLAGLVAAEPEEIALRLIGRALDDGADEPVRLERLEACLAALNAAAAHGRPLRRTFRGRVLSLDARGLLRIAPESTRRRGIHSSSS